MAIEPAEEVLRKTRQEALLNEYKEVSNNFRLLTDIRFKLLAFLPIAAAATAALRGTGAATAGTAVTTLGVSMFGLVVTAGLVSYNSRNDQLYNELVGRAAHIERCLGLPDGAFANRPTTWLSLPLGFGKRWSISHGNSLACIYGATLTLWLFMFFNSIVQLAYGGETPSWYIVGAALVVAGGTVFAAGWAVTNYRSAREDDMRAAATRAVALARHGLNVVAFWPNFHLLCAGLRDAGVGASEPFRKLLALPVEEVVDAPDVSSDDLQSQVQTVRRRAEFYARLDGDEERVHYGLESPDASSSGESRFVALITDLPPRWIEDVATQRR
jgi:hypothetical protein